MALGRFDTLKDHNSATTIPATISPPPVRERTLKDSPAQIKAKRAANTGSDAKIRAVWVGEVYFCAKV